MNTKIIEFSFNILFRFVIIFLPLYSSSHETKKIFVYFKFNEYALDLSSKDKIDSTIQNQNILEVRIDAHCDSVGSDSYNDKLSLKRALEVKKYLSSKVPDESIIITHGSGKHVPLNKNENENARALNRRAEIIFNFDNPEPAIKPDTIVKDSTKLDIKDIEVGSTFRLENLNFEGGRHKLLPQSERTLKLLLNTLKENPDLVIEIQGHICCKPSGEGYDFDTGTLNLSENRARAIYDYLINNGISQRRLTYKGFGASHKLVEEKSETDQSTNRRVEIKIIKK